MGQQDKYLPRINKTAIIKNNNKNALNAGLNPTNQCVFSE
jgi:hypothetical protein